MNKAMSTILFVLVQFILVFIIVIFINSTRIDTPLIATPTSTIPSTEPVSNNMYTLAQIGMHATKADCWTAINGNVYDVTSFIPNHPGGNRILVVCGKDGTAAFTSQHNGDPNPAAVLAKLKIGTLAK